jgi:hypothetical protein
MARGWESKSAEEQSEQRAEERAEAEKGIAKAKMTPADAAKLRMRQLLELKRERILSEKTSHPARRAALQSALQEIEVALKQLG